MVHIDETYDPYAKESDLKSNDICPMLSKKREDRIKRGAATHARNHLHWIPLFLCHFPCMVFVLLLPPFEFLFVIRRLLAASACDVTTVLRHRRSGGDERSLRNTRYRALRTILHTVLLPKHLVLGWIAALDRNIPEKKSSGFRALQLKGVICQLLLNANQDRWPSKQGFDYLPGGLCRVLLVSEYSGPLGDCGSEQRVRQLPLPTLLFLSGLLGFGDPVCSGDHGIPQSVVPKDVFERSKRGGLPGVVIVGQ